MQTKQIDLKENSNKIHYSITKFFAPKDKRHKKKLEKDVNKIIDQFKIPCFLTEKDGGFILLFSFKEMEDKSKQILYCNCCRKEIGSSEYITNEDLKKDYPEFWDDLNLANEDDKDELEPYRLKVLNNQIWEDWGKNQAKFQIKNSRSVEESDFWKNLLNRLESFYKPVEEYNDLKRIIFECVDKIAKELYDEDNKNSKKSSKSKNISYDHQSVVFAKKMYDAIQNKETITFNHKQTAKKFTKDFGFKVDGKIFKVIEDDSEDIIINFEDSDFKLNKGKKSDFNKNFNH